MLLLKNPNILKTILLLAIVFNLTACQTDKSEEKKIPPQTTVVSENDAINTSENASKENHKTEVNSSVDNKTQDVSSSEKGNSSKPQDQKIVESTTKASDDYTVKNFESINLIGISYNIENNLELVQQKIKQKWGEFLLEGFYKQIDVVGNNLYLIFSGYSQTGFKVFMGYEVNDFNVIPDGTISKETPTGAYALFKMADGSEASYKAAWSEAEQASKKRSYQADMEIHTIDWNTFKTEAQEIRLHLK